MKKKKRYVWGILLIALMLIVIGSSYAYFVTLFKDERNNENNGNLNTGSLSSATMIANIPGSAGSFLEKDVYPGHKEVIGIKVSATGNIGSSSSFQFKYFVEKNDLGKDIKVSLYKNKDPIETNSNYFNCQKQTVNLDGITQYFESCEEKELGKLLEETQLTGGTEEKIIGKDTLTIKTEEKEEQGYYYVVIEFLNLENQDNLMGKELKGKINVELIPYYEIVSNEFHDVLVACGKKGISAADCMLENSLMDEDNLRIDTTKDTNLRYVGPNPNNYVDIGEIYEIDIYRGYYSETNNEYREYIGEDNCQNATSYKTNCTKVRSIGDPILWRIIGVMNNVEDGKGNKESRIKLIRENSIGNYSWDSSPSNINTGYGINEWSTADIKYLLNSGPYWNRATGTCYNSFYNKTTGCDFSKTGLMENTKNLIDDAVWYTGATKAYSFSNLYDEERDTKTGKACSGGSNCNDSVKRTTSWTGKIGLMYPSDIKYSLKDGNWLYYHEYQWTITPYINEYDASKAIRIYFGRDELDKYTSAGQSSAIRPTMYLKSQVKIIAGEGTKDNPYKLSL